MKPLLTFAGLAATVAGQSSPTASAALPRILAIPVGNATSVAVVLGVRTAVFDEPDGRSGAAHLVEHLVLHSPAGDVADPFVTLSTGGPFGQSFLDCNAETMWSGTYFHALRPAPRVEPGSPEPDTADLERTLGVFADAVALLQLTAREPDGERSTAVRAVPAAVDAGQRSAMRLAAEVCAQRLRRSASKRLSDPPHETGRAPAVTVWIETPADDSLRIAISGRAVDGAGGAAAVDHERLQEVLAATMRSLSSEPELRAARRAATMMLTPRLRSAHLARVPDGAAGHRTLVLTGIDRVIVELAGGDFVRLVEQAEQDAVHADGHTIAASVGGR